MMLQKDLIHSVDWDILCVLDACRSDTFESLYKKYLSGDYQTVESPEIPTPQWSAFTFPEQYDWIYCSANPYINNWVRHHQTGWLAAEHFDIVETVFVWGWQQIGGIETVPPWKVNEAIFRWLPDDKRIIAHYMQPHAPYVGDTKLAIGSFKGTRDEVLGIAEKKPFELQALEMRNALLIKAYRDNLKFVLNYISAILPDISDKKVVITADHGEHLGENGLFGHTVKTGFTTMVPWLELECHS